MSTWCVRIALWPGLDLIPTTRWRLDQMDGFGGMLALELTGVAGPRTVSCESCVSCGTRRAWAG